MFRRLVAPLVVAVALAGCGGSGESDGGGGGSRPPAAASKEIRANPANAKTTLTIASKNFTEQFILGEIYAQALEAGGYKVHKRLDYGPDLVAFRGLKTGKIDAYPEYTGTALTTLFD